jgi:hypothetical protein
MGANKPIEDVEATLPAATKSALDEFIWWPTRRWQRWSLKRHFGVLPEELGGLPSSAVIAKAFTGAKLVKGFNHLVASTLAADPTVEGGHRVVVEAPTLSRRAATCLFSGERLWPVPGLAYAGNGCSILSPLNLT